MTSYCQTRCKKCGGMKTVVKEDKEYYKEYKEPKTFHVDLPEKCGCEEKRKVKMK